MRLKTLSWLLAGMALAGTASADDTTNSTNTTTIDTRNTFGKLLTVQPMVSPGSSVMAPAAFGLTTGDVFFAASAATGGQTSHKAFGSLAGGFGLGDPNRAVSLMTSISESSISDLGQNGNMNFQLSRNLDPTSAIAVGTRNVMPWGSDESDRISTYAVASKQFAVQVGQSYTLPIIVSAGGGNERFAHFVGDTSTSEIGFFGSVGVQVMPQVALIGENVGQAYNAGVSIVPIPSWPVVANFTANDLTHKGGPYVAYTATLAVATHL